MFSLEHGIWFLLSVTCIVIACLLLRKYKPSLRSVLIGCFVIAVLSRFFIMFTSIDFVPSSDGETIRPYLSRAHFPFHLCAVQFFLILIAIFAKKQPFKDGLLAFIYATGIGGASMSLILCTVFDSVSPEKSFTYPRAYEYHIYHSMLIVLGIYILMSGEVKFKPKHILTTFVSLFCAAWCSIYVNSLFSSPTYENGKLISVDYNTNFFFTFEPPIKIAITQAWQWALYLLVLLAAVIILELILFTPALIIQKRRDKKELT